jgi:hypothetical protein
VSNAADERLDARDLADVWTPSLGRSRHALNQFAAD